MNSAHVQLNEETETSYEIEYRSGLDLEWTRYGVTPALSTAREVIKELKTKTNIKDWRVKKVTITVTTLSGEEE